MHIFISWSGKRADAVARALDVFLTDVLDGATIFISQDLGGGTRWSEEIDQNLDLADYGIVCLTQDKYRAPWINYEAGALGRAVPGKERKRVVPLMLDHDNPSDVPQPLSLFNVSRSDRSSITARVREMNAMGKNSVRDDTLMRRFDMAWPSLEGALQLAAILPDAEASQSEPVASTDLATVDEKMDEILSYIRRSEPAGGKLVSPYFVPPAGVAPTYVAPTYDGPPPDSGRIELLSAALSERLDALASLYRGQFTYNLMRFSDSLLVQLKLEAPHLRNAFESQLSEIIGKLRASVDGLNVSRTVLPNEDSVSTDQLKLSFS